MYVCNVVSVNLIRKPYWKEKNGFHVTSLFIRMDLSVVLLHLDSHLCIILDLWFFLQQFYSESFALRFKWRYITFLWKVGCSWIIYIVLVFAINRRTRSVCMNTTHSTFSILSFYRIANTSCITQHVRLHFSYLV